MRASSAVRCWHASVDAAVSATGTSRHIRAGRQPCKRAEERAQSRRAAVRNVDDRCRMPAAEEPLTACSPGDQPVIPSPERLTAPRRPIRAHRRPSAVLRALQIRPMPRHGKPKLEWLLLVAALALLTTGGAGQLSPGCACRRARAVGLASVQGLPSSFVQPRLCAALATGPCKCWRDRSGVQQP